MDLTKSSLPFAFAHEEPRKEQLELANSVYAVLEAGKQLITHAPTGLGKTAAVLSPAVSYAVKHKKIVFFLTSRYTQHKIALDTLKMLSERHGLKFGVVDLIAKRNMCAVPGAELLSAGEFLTYCKKQRENHLCDFYEKTRKRNMELTVDAKAHVETQTGRILEVVEAKKESTAAGLCPFEISLEVGKQATVIIADYNYVFHPQIRDGFLTKIGVGLKDCIAIVDEAHNLADRAKEMTSQRLSTFMLTNAIREAQEFGMFEVLTMLQHINTVLEQFSDVEAVEQLVTQDWFFDGVSEAFTYGQILDAFDEARERVYEKQQRSFISGVYDFLVGWQGPSEGYTRLIRKEQSNERNSIVLCYRCLDARVVLSDSLNTLHSTIFMSGTLNPLPFYRSILGVKDDATELVFSNPFPKQNALHLIVPETTTKYDERSDEQFGDIATILASVVNSVKGNCAVFFPSYYLLKNVAITFQSLCEMSVFVESQSMTKTERSEMLESFKKYKNVGAVLLGVSSGSFGEGIDLPGDFLRCVVIVGLPLPKPDLETRQLIKYYDSVFKRGWDFGYIYPAFNKTLQNAGRCIRTHDDRGVIVYLDKRYIWPQYKQCFPSDINLKVSNGDYVPQINSFFEKK